MRPGAGCSREKCATAPKMAKIIGKT